ncbi:MAG: crotonase/enoyl-CoA hydratase family protein, partial [Ilumatobacteraceae bacterium]
RHLQRAVSNARITTPRDAVDVGFLDEVVSADQLLDRAVAIAQDLATTLDPAAYAGTVVKLRGDVLATMAAQVAADRAAAG